MFRVLETLLVGVPSEVANKVRRRATALFRDFDYQIENNNNAASNVRTAGWSPQTVKIILELNAFYQLIIAPLGSSSRRNVNVSIGSEIPIKYGKNMVFDQTTTQDYQELQDSFKRTLFQLEVNERYLMCQRASDLLYLLERDIDA